MKIILLLSGLFLLFSFSSCRNKNPNLSKEELLTELNREPEKKKELPVIPEGYVPPAGIKYTAERDFSVPLVRLDIVAGLKNEQPVKLSDFAKEVVYYRVGDLGMAGIGYPIAIPGGYVMNMLNGVWLLKSDFAADRMLIKYDVTISGNKSFTMINRPAYISGLYYNEEMRFLHYTLVTEDTNEDGKRNIYVGTVLLDELLSAPASVDVQNLKKELNAGRTGGIYPVKGGYALSGYYSTGLYTFDMKGDTLCYFEPGTVSREWPQGTIRGAESSDYYLYNGLLHYRLNYTDTVFQVLDASTFRPVYKIDLGNYQVDRLDGLKASFCLAEKYLVWGIVETDDRLYLRITQDYDCPSTRKSGAVKFYQLIYEKKDKRLYSFMNRENLSQPGGGNIPNDLDNGLPFWPDRQIGGKPYMAINKRLLGEYFPNVKQDQLPAALQGLGENEFVLITIK